jgi:hypothetical protein
MGIEQDQNDVLEGLLTAREVCELWGRARTVVRYHLDRGNFKWRYTLDSRILVERASVVGLQEEPGE